MGEMEVEQFCDLWWGHWRNFAEEFIFFVEEGYDRKSVNNASNRAIIFLFLSV